MTDPVDTNALRTAGKRADYYQTGDGPTWRAAADEVDRLRTELAWMTEHAGQRASAYERLRAAIENAPHDVGCATAAESLLGAARDPQRPCICWKGDL